MPPVYSFIAWSGTGKTTYLEGLIAALPALVRPGDVILVKASRGARFERISEALKELEA